MTESTIRNHKEEAIGLIAKADNGMLQAQGAVALLWAGLLRRRMSHERAMNGQFNLARPDEAMKPIRFLMSSRYSGK
jgi:hypothetical protein